MAQEPYLRVDIAFSEPEARESNLRLPDGMYVYGAEELGIADELARVRDAVGPRSASDGVFHLSLYVTNLQQQPLGIADQIDIWIRAVWDLDDPEHGTHALPVSLAYLGPRQTTAVELMAVRQRMDMLLVFVEELSYRDLLRDTVRDAHGALQMYYTWDKEHEHAVVWNERGVQRGEAI
jgi:hypothetical protein